ncbi:MAG: hypothetical protein IPN73_00280 [Saprospiraceae bacterium]|nr:hypothetical protein [Saprospiraceae bacterium]
MGQEPKMWPVLPDLQEALTLAMGGETHRRPYQRIEQRFEEQLLNEVKASCLITRQVIKYVPSQQRFIFRILNGRNVDVNLDIEACSHHWQCV